MGLITHPHTSHNQSNWGITIILYFYLYVDSFDIKLSKLQCNDRLELVDCKRKKFKKKKKIGGLTIVLCQKLIMYCGCNGRPMYENLI